MRHPRASVPMTATFALLIAFGCLCAGASAHTKTDRAPKRPHLPRPPVHLIECAVVFDGSPCWPDPGMVQPDRRRWHVDPPVEPLKFRPAR